jgi:polygalacturonase
VKNSTWILVPISVLLLCSTEALAAGRTCNVRQYGAVSDGTTKSTAAIQAAIEACEKAGGGTVVIEGGTFVSGPIVLRDHITLSIAEGATLMGSPDHADYPAKTEFRSPGMQSLVSATGATDVAITGSGTIDGNGASWWAEARAYKDAGILGSEHTRPRLVVFDRCHHVLVEGVTLQNSPMWQLVPYNSDDVTIRNIRVLAPAKSPNTDAIDPFSSSNVVIDHVYADVGDDDIAIKSGAIDSPGGDLPSRNIRITNVDFHHGHGLSIGSEIAGGAQNITVEHVKFTDTDNGIRIKANRDRGNDVSHISFNDVQMDHVKIALIISEYYPSVLPQGVMEAAPVTRLTPHFHDIVITNVKATATKSAGAIVGLPEAPIAGVTLKNITIDAPVGLMVGYASVLTQQVEVHTESGPGITKLAGAVVNSR